MKDSDSPNQPTAASVLARFEEICMSLKQEDVEREVKATRWIFGNLKYRNGLPVYWAPNQEV